MPRNRNEEIGWSEWVVEAVRSHIYAIETWLRTKDWADDDAVSLSYSDLPNRLTSAMRAKGLHLRDRRLQRAQYLRKLVPDAA